MENRKVQNISKELVQKGFQTLLPKFNPLIDIILQEAFAEKVFELYGICKGGALFRNNDTYYLLPNISWQIQGYLRPGDIKTSSINR